jgi:hypothetical protein
MGGCFYGSGRKRLKEPHLGRGIEGGDQSPIRDLTGWSQKRKVLFMAQFRKS